MSRPEPSQPAVQHVGVEAGAQFGAVRFGAAVARPSRGRGGGCAASRLSRSEHVGWRGTSRNERGTPADAVEGVKGARGQHPLLPA